MSNFFKLEIPIAALSCRIASLKAILTADQLLAYENKMKELREKYIADHPNADEEELKMISDLFK